MPRAESFEIRELDQNEITRLCRQEILDLLEITNTSEIPSDPWDEIIHDFAVENAGSELTPEEIREKFKVEMIET